MTDSRYRISVRGQDIVLKIAYTKSVYAGTFLSKVRLGYLYVFYV